MNAELFRREVVDYVEGAYRGFLSLQEATAATLDEVVRVIERAHIDYQLAWGSLLGAVRDGGQIPWDYDVDIFVPIYQRPALVKALRDGLDGDRYYVDSFEFNPECSHYIMRVAPVEFDSEHLHVDIFFLCGAPKGRGDVFAGKLRRVCRTRYWKFVDWGKRAGQSRAKRACFSVLHAAASLVPNWAMDRRYRSLAFKYPVSKSGTLVQADRFAASFSFPAEVLETIEIEVSSGKKFKVAKDYEVLLNRMYGNYREYKPISLRFAEFYGHYVRTEKSRRS